MSAGNLLNQKVGGHRPPLQETKLYHYPTGWQATCGDYGEGTVAEASFESELWVVPFELAAVTT